jgi:predicted AAA+ superfamily ATPase
VAVSNRDRVAKAFETLAEGLESYVDRSMRKHFGDDWLAKWAAQERGKVSLHDPQFLLKVMRESWQAVFSRALGRTERTYVHELSDRRNDWAHNEPFTADDTDRTLDTAERLLNAVNAGQLAGSIRKQKEELRRLYLENDNARAAKKLAVSAEAPVAGLRPWREIALPQTDVQSGRYAQAEFAADLGQVARGEGSAEYVDPVEFFRRTYLTDGLSALLREAVQRVTGQAGGAPVIDLQTNFGGGKTHSLLALYHLFSGTPTISFPPEVQALLGGQALPAVRRAVLVGTQISPGQPAEKPDGTKIRTLWGELAWQLGGRAAYEEVAEADATSSNPGEALRVLLERHSPALILIDEWVAYARQLYLDSTMPAGSFDTHFTFAQALTEAARTTPGVLLVVSIPASDRLEDGATSGGSDIEVGGEGGREALRRLQNVVRRMDSSWRPASPQESYEIVRRRLFEEIRDATGLQARDLTARRFGEHYRQYGGQLPRECLDPAYEQRIRQSYPIHPELFARLYEDWSTLERFQQTRGVLRLMSKVIHALWVGNDQAPVILPGSVPLDDEQVVGELTRNLEDRWKPILDTDVDGRGSLPARLDEEKAAFGQRAAARRVARAVFLGSAPTSRNANKGIEDQRIRLGVLMPGEAPALFGDALRSLAERATFLYVENQRYWFSVQPTLSRKAAEIADRHAQRPEEVHFALTEWLRRSTAERADFAAVHVSSTLTSADVPDEPRVRLVVVPPNRPHRPKTASSEAVTWAREILTNRGTALREHRNMLVFLAADGQALLNLEQAVCAWLAWQEICQTLGEEELTPSQAQQARDRLTKAEEAVALRVAETYKWLLVPEQEQPPAGPVELVEVRIEGPDKLPARAARRLVNDGRLHRELAPVHVRLKLDGPLATLWKDGDVPVQEIWNAFSRYPYLPRVRDVDVLLDAVRRGPAGLTWSIDGFAVATAWDHTTGRYRGLVVNDEARGVDLSTLIVRPELALTQHEQDLEAPETGQSRRDDQKVVERDIDEERGPTARTSPTRFTGSVQLDPERLVKTFGAANIEVLAHLLNSGAAVNVTLEVAADLPEGFDDSTLRVVTENAKTLKFDGTSFS